MAKLSKPAFERYFTLEEAVATLPQIQPALNEALEEISAIKQQIILFKRILSIQSGEQDDAPSDEQLDHLKNLYTQFETAYAKWIAHFNDQGILLRDIEQGLIDFPYHAKTHNEDFFLCWRRNESGLFYFHPVDSGFAGRQPISLLPD